MVGGIAGGDRGCLVVSRSRERWAGRCPRRSGTVAALFAPGDFPPRCRLGVGCRDARDISLSGFCRLPDIGRQWPRQGRFGRTFYGGAVMRPMYGRNHLRRAAALLDGPADYLPCPSALADVFGHVWSAVALSHHWVSEDRADLAWLIAASRRYGTCAETAWKMNVDEVIEFRSELSRVLACVARGPTDEVRARSAVSGRA